MLGAPWVLKGRSTGVSGSSAVEATLVIDAIQAFVSICR